MDLLRRKDDSIVLIIPPSPFLLDERVFMSLGILKIAAFLKKNGIAVQVLDLSGISNYLDALTAFLAKCPTAVFGITSTTPQFPVSLKIAKTIRINRTNAFIIIGGPHATLTVSAAKREEITKHAERARNALERLRGHFDVIVAGDGEFAILEALAADRGTLIDADRLDSPFFLKNKDFEDLPFPDRSFLDVSSYHFQIEGKQGLSLIAQLGCPFACGFCAGRTSPTFRRIRLRSPENIISEIEYLYETYHTEAFMFYDDELNVNPQLETLLSGLITLQRRLGVEFLFRGCVKAELFTNKQAKLLREAGFRILLVGFESGSPRILKNINKKATVDDNSRCREIARANQIKIKALMSVGHPGESPESIDETRRWLVKTQPDDFDVSIITILPGTPYYDNSTIKEKDAGVWVYVCPDSKDHLYSFDIDFANVLSYYKGNPKQKYSAFVFTDFLQPFELVAARDCLETSLRMEMGIPFPKETHSQLYDHSMGQVAPVFSSSQK
jgi:anaerobic magnesium-protoporphyrin IX monomethyl ester cyclase